LSSFARLNGVTDPDQIPLTANKWQQVSKNPMECQLVLAYQSIQANFVRNGLWYHEMAMVVLIVAVVMVMVRILSGTT
jgi:hypothetical protein